MKEPIPIRLHPNNTNKGKRNRNSRSMDAYTTKKHNRRSVTKRKGRHNAPITTNHGALNSDTWTNTPRCLTKTTNIAVETSWSTQDWFFYGIVNMTLTQAWRPWSLAKRNCGFLWCWDSPPRHMTTWSKDHDVDKTHDVMLVVTCEVRRLATVMWRFQWGDCCYG